MCLGITPHICPPHRPDKNAYVERFHRTYGHECLQVHQPSTLQEVREVTEAFLQHYHYERPHQGRSCGNVPPRTAFPTLPKLPALPERVDPDAWLATLDQKMYVRHVGRDGCVNVDLQTYYIGPQMAKRAVLLQVLAENRQFAVWHQDQVIKLFPGPRADWPGDGLVRLCAVHPARSAGCSSTLFCSFISESPPVFSVGARNLISWIIYQLSQALAHVSSKCGKCCLHSGQRRKGTQNNLLRRQSSLLVACSSYSLIPFSFLRPQLFLAQPHQFR